MKQLSNVRQIIAEMRLELNNIMSRVNSTTNCETVKEELNKLIGYITVLTLLIGDMMDPAMHRMYWPTH